MCVLCVCVCVCVCVFACMYINVCLCEWSIECDLLECLLFLSTVYISFLAFSIN